MAGLGYLIHIKHIRPLVFTITRCLLLTRLIHFE